MTFFPCLGKASHTFPSRTNTENLLSANEVSFCPLVRPSLLVHGEVKFVDDRVNAVPLCMSRSCFCFCFLIFQ